VLCRSLRHQTDRPLNKLCSTRSCFPMASQRSPASSQAGSVLHWRERTELQWWESRRHWYAPRFSGRPGRVYVPTSIGKATFPVGESKLADEPGACPGEAIPRSPGRTSCAVLPPPPPPLDIVLGRRARHRASITSWQIARLWDYNGDGGSDPGCGGTLTGTVTKSGLINGG